MSLYNTRTVGDVKVVMLKGQDGKGSIPSGGTAGQVLTKSGDADYEVIWSTLKNSRAVELSETNIQTEVGTAKTVTVKYRVAGISDTATYTSSDTGVATVAVTGHSSTGTSATDVITITPVANGDCTIKIAFANEVGYDAEYDYINVTVGAASGGKQTTIIDLSESNVVLDESLTDTVTVTYSGAAATFTSSDTSVATVDVTSASAVGNTYTYVITITAKKEGACSIEVDVPENSSYYGAKAYINVTAAISIYGAEWDGSSSPAWTRTDMATNFVDPVPYYSGMSGTPSSPFDDIMPWKGMRRITDASAGELVEIPKFYYKWTRSGSSMKLQISMKPFTGCHVSPAHADRGDGVGERDYVYVGRYKTDHTSFKSKTNVVVERKVDIYPWRAGVQSLAEYTQVWDISMLNTIQMLYIVEYANFDSQTKIGCGGSSPSTPTGYTDYMPYHTGTTQSDRDTFGNGVQYRYIEGLWDNYSEIMEGIVTAGIGGRNLYVTIKPSGYSDVINKGVNIGQIGNISAGFISKLIESYITCNISGLEFLLFPLVSNTDYTDQKTYTTDRLILENNSSITHIAKGGGASNSNGHGLFYLYGIFPDNETYSLIASRIMAIPANRL